MHCNASPSPRPSLASHYAVCVCVQPKLADATVQRDAAVAALLEALGVQGVSVQSAADLRSTVARLIGEAQRLPSMPPFVDYRPLLAELQWWQEELAGARGDVAAAQQAAGDAAAANEAQLSAADKEADPEEWHRLNWLRWVGAGQLAH